MADEKPYNISIETQAQIAELQKLLAELKSINAEIAKLNGLTFDALNASASELIKTGRELSSALTSLPKSSKRAADGVKKIGEESKKTRREVDGLKVTAEGVFMELGAKITDFAVHKVKQIPAAIRASIEAFGQQEMAALKLSAAIRAGGGSVSEVLPIMSAFASEMQKITTYGDEQVLAMQAMATSMGVGADQMQGVIKSAIGLATALNMDVMTAIKASSAAVQGKTTMLQEYIPSLAKCKTEEEKLAQVQKLSASGFSRAQAEAESTSGMLKQAANAWGDLAETVGGTFAPVAVEVAGALKFVCEWLSKNGEIIQVLVGGLSSLAIGFTFSKIGGLANVAALFKMVASSITGAKIASEGLNFSLKMNPFGMAVGAVSALAMIVSHLRSEEKKRYKENIEQSREYRDAIDEEIDAMNQWGISAGDNEKRTAEVAAEIKRLRAEQIEYQKSHGSMRGSFSGVMYKVYSDEEQAAIDNYRAKIEKLEERQKAAAKVKELDALKTKTHAAAMAAQNEILAKSRQEMRAAASAAEALKQTREKYAATEKEIAILEEGRAKNTWADSERAAKAERLRQARLELLELGKREIEQELSIASSKYASLKTAELKNQNDLEVRLAGARLRGNNAETKSLELELEGAKTQRRKLDIITSYIDARKSEIKSAEDLNRIQAEAARYANATLEAERQKAESEKWLAGEIERSKTAQRDMETDILRLRASGDEIGAREVEQRLRISQIASEIFETTRREGMSREELSRLQASANEQAREKYELEKSITDETERQNLAKDAQAKIEDILLTNKIEQLKAEGKLTEARELEREREIKRTLAGMKGLSDADRDSIASTMRQTNEYRDRQEKMRKAGGGASYSGGAGGSMPTRGGSFGGSQSGYGGGAAKYAGPTPPRRPRPASVSAKYRGLYDEWKAGGGSQSGESWTDYRMRRAGEVDAESEERNAYEETRRADENAPVAEKRARAGDALREAAEKSRDMGSRVRLPKPGGALADASGSGTGKRENLKSPKPPEEPQKAGKNSIMAAKLKNRGVEANSSKASAGAGGGDSFEVLKRIEMQLTNLVSSTKAN